VHGEMIGLGETGTLGYEGGAVQAPGMPQETMVGATARPPSYAPPVAAPLEQQSYGVPQQPQYGAPQYSMPPAQPYAQGQPQGQQPAPGYEAYEYYEEEPRSNPGRWVAIGCGCLAIVCLLVLVVVAFLIDTMNLWCDVPIVPQLFNLNCAAALGALLLALL